MTRPTMKCTADNRVLSPGFKALQSDLIPSLTRFLARFPTLRFGSSQLDGRRERGENRHAAQARLATVAPVLHNTINRCHERQRRETCQENVTSFESGMRCRSRSRPRFGRMPIALCESAQINSKAMSPFGTSQATEHSRPFFSFW